MTEAVSSGTKTKTQIPKYQVRENGKDLNLDVLQTKQIFFEKTKSCEGACRDPEQVSQFASVGL